MKTLRSFLFLFSLCVLLFSCGSDDDSGNNNEPAPVIGVWDLVELNVSPAQDIDQDGTSNSNIIDELNCVTGILTINEVGTWSLSLNGVTVTSITGGLFDINCSSTPSFNSGTWAFQNNQLTLFQGVDPIILTLNGDVLTNLVGETLPDFSSEIYQRR
ncbi:hypothetical protein LVD13_07415 [Flavobacteriaceae bacterium D16]|nr:hypothetical protein [Flavobacteriaceae bacterium D16]